MQQSALPIDPRVIGLILAATLSWNRAAAQVTQPSPNVAAQPGPTGESASSLLLDMQVSGVTPGMTLDDVLRVGFTALQNQQLGQAEKIFAAALKEDPRNASAMMGLANTYELENQHARRSADPEVSSRAEALSDGAAQWYLAAGTLFQNTGDHTRAGQCYQRALTLQPLNHMAQLGIARASAALQQDVAAREQFKKSLKNKAAPADTLAQANLELARVYRRSRFFALALDALNTALGRDRENPEIYIELARINQDKTQLADARSHAETAIRKSPGNPEYHIVLALILTAQSELQGAADAALRAIGLARQQLRAEDLNGFRTLSGYYGVYIQVLQQMLAKDPANTLARLDMARSIQEQADVNQALALYQSLEVLRRAPATERRNPRLLEAMAGVMAALNGGAPPRNTARQLLQIEPGNTLAQRILQQTEPSAAPATQSGP